MLKLPSNRPFTKIEAIVDYFCFVKRAVIPMSIKELSFRWNWPKSTASDLVKYIESTKFAREDKWLFDFITKPYSMSLKRVIYVDDKQEKQPQEQLLFGDLFIMQDIQHPFTGKFAEAWVEWINHLKREKNKSFRSLKSMQKAVDFLVRKAGTETKAIDMINYSIFNNWASIREEEAPREHKKKAKETKNNQPENKILDTNWSSASN